MQSAVLLKSNRGAGGGRRSVNGARKVPRASPSVSGDDVALNTLKVVRKFDTQKRRRGEGHPDFGTERTDHQRHRQWFKMTGGR